MTEIDKTSLVQACTRMGYRRVNPTKDAWAKPMGYSILLIHLVDNKFVLDQWFVGADKKQRLWTSVELDLTPDAMTALVHQIKEFEEWSYRSMSGYGAGTHDYSFLTTEQQLEAMVSLDRRT